jgi:hypothetical protein
MNILSASRWGFLIPCVGLTVLFLNSTAQSYTVNGYAPSNSGPFFGNAIIPGSVVLEDFEDLTLYPGLLIDAGSGFGSSFPTTGLPRISDSHPASAWDGTGAFYNTEATGVTTTFRFSTPSSFWGIGVSDLDAADLSLSVNGSVLVSSVNSLPGFVANDESPQIYLTITQAPGDDPIQDVGFTVTGLGGSVVFDHLVSTPIPEPSTALLLGLGLAGMAARRRV